MKKRVKILIVIISIIFVILASEIIVRLFYSQELYNECHKDYPIKNTPIIYDELYGWTLEKNFTGCSYFNGEKIYYKTNSLGLRMEKEVEPTKTKKRILLLGDSMIYGDNVNEKDTYYYKLQKYLGDNYEVINMAVSGYGTDQELSKLLEEGNNLNPDIVIINIALNDYSNNFNIFYMPNGTIFESRKNAFILHPKQIAGKLTDFLTYFNLDYNILEQIDLVYIENKNKKKIDTKTIDKDYNFLDKNSHLYVLFKKFILKLQEEKNSRDNDYNLIHKDRSYFYLLEKDYIVDYNASIALTFRILNEISKVSKAEVIYVNIPFRAQHDEKFRKKLMKKYKGMEDLEFEFEKINKIQKEFMDFKNYNYIDLLPYLKNEKNIYLKNDNHWNNKGADAAAKTVANYIKNN